MSDDWYVIEGKPLTLADLDELEKSRAYRVLMRIMETDISVCDAQRDSAEVNERYERYLTGKAAGLKWWKGFVERTREVIVAANKRAFEHV